MLFPVTLFRSMVTTTRFEVKTCLWGELKELFSSHLRTLDKEGMPGFGPYALVGPEPSPCPNPKHSAYASIPHRCDMCVRALSLAVYDVDVGTTKQVEACSANLITAGIAHLWYSSHSYKPADEVPRLRLVIPLSKPVSTGAWRMFRDGLGERFSVPYDTTKCGGASHFYFWPSCPPEADPIFDAHDGPLFDVTSVPAYSRPSTPRLPTIAYQPPPEPDSLDLAPLRKRLLNKANGLVRRQDAKEKAKGELLIRCLEGEPLAPHGSRNTDTHLACNVISWALPEASLGTLMHLIAPSLEAMIAEGSSLTHAEVEAMFLRGMASKAAAEQRNSELEDFFANMRNRRHNT